MTEAYVESQFAKIRQTLHETETQLKQTHVQHNRQVVGQPMYMSDLAKSSTNIDPSKVQEHISRIKSLQGFMNRIDPLHPTNIGKENQTIYTKHRKTAKFICIFCVLAVAIIVIVLMLWLLLSLFYQ